MIIIYLILGVTIGILSHKFTKSPSYKTNKIIGFLWKKSAEITGDVEFLESKLTALEIRVEKLESGF